MRTPLPRAVRTAAVAVAAVSTLGLSACGGDTAGTEAGADVEDVVEEEPLEDGPYDGVYDSAFSDEVDGYAGEEVTLSADVNEVITPEAFTIAGTDDTSVEALLVVGATGDTELVPETTVGVTGTVMESFVLTDVEADLGVDLDDALFAEWEQEPYVMAESVDVLENAEG